MRLLDDERGQSVQVGAAILLGFVVIAITMYQVQVVPSQNEEVEFNHNQDVRQDMTELRNAINDVGTEDSSRSSSVQLGTQYPARSIFVNPPPPRGTLQTETIGDISIENASVTNPGDYENETKVTDLLQSNHTTSHIFYRPDYTEFDGAPTTYIEHSLAYDRSSNGFGNPVTPQSIVDGDSLTLTVLRGNVSEQGSGSVSLDPRTVSGPTDTIDIEEDGGPITLDLPTASPDVWNETFAENSDVTVVDWDSDAGTIGIELSQSSYELQMAMVGMGNGVPQSGRYDVSHSDSGNGSNSAYSVQWSNSQSDVALTNCDSAGCEEDYQVVTGTEDVNLSAETDPNGISGADVDFSYLDTDGVGVTPGPDNDSEFSGGSATYELESFDQEGAVQAYVASGVTSDVISIEVVGGLLPNITNSNSPIEEGEELSITTEIQNTGGQEETENVELSLSGQGVVDSQSVTVASGGTETVTLTWQTSDSEIGEYEATVRTADAADSTSVNVQEDVVPPNAVGYADENGDGNYDDGEQTYQPSDLSGISTSDDVYLVRNATVGSMDIQGGAIVVESGVRLATQNGQATITSSTDEVRIAGTIDTTATSGSGASISSAESMNLTGASLLLQEGLSVNPSGELVGNDLTVSTESDYGSLDIDGSASGTFNNADLIGGGSVDLAFSGEVDVSGSTVESVRSQLTITSNNARIVANDATINSSQSLTMSSSTTVSTVNANIKSDQNSITITANGGAVDADGAALSSPQGTSLESTGNMSIRNADIEVSQDWATMSGVLNQPSNTLFVDGASFANPGPDDEFQYSPEDITVVGQPGEGSTVPE